jgi:thiamine kinase-like enzyme
LKTDRSPKSIQSEIEISQLFGDLGVAPKVYAASLEKKAFLIDEIQGGPLMRPKLTHEQLSDLSRKIAIVHQVSPPPTLNKRFTAKEVVQRVISRDLPFTLPKEYTEALKALTPSFEKLEEKERFALTHLDLNPGNILMGTDLKIIDWENAKISHPYLDLATILIFYDLSDSERRPLFKGESAQVDPQELAAAYKVANYIYALSVLGISYKGAQGGEHPRIVEINQLRDQMAQRKWGEIIPRLGNKDVAFTISQLFLEIALK